MLNSRALLGIALIVLGGLFLLGQAEVIDAGELIADWWPVVFIAAAALALADRPSRPIAAGVLAVIGVVLLSATTGVLSGAVLSVLWPVALIAIGLWIVSGRRLGRTVVDSGDAVEGTVIFGGRELTNTSSSFEGGSLTVVFGGLELDLLRAAPASDARLDVTTIFGGTEITVPDDWRVVIDGPAIFGGYDNASTVTDAAAPTLRLRVLVLFGGLEVKTQPRPAGAAPGVADSADGLR